MVVDFGRAAEQFEVREADGLASGLQGQIQELVLGEVLFLFIRLNGFKIIILCQNL